MSSVLPRSLLPFVVITFNAKESRETSQLLSTRFLHYPHVYIYIYTFYQIFDAKHVYHVGRFSVLRRRPFFKPGSSYNPTHTKKRARTLESLTRATVLCESVKGQPQTPFAFSVSGTSQNRQTFSFASRRKVSSTLCYRLR